MLIRVEFYGIPRQRAGIDHVLVESDETTSLGELLRKLGRQFPALATDCFEGGNLRSGYTVNLGGERFISDPNELLSPHQYILILSADAGGA